MIQSSFTYILLTLRTQDAYRHGWLIDLLINYIPGREAFLQEREFKLGRSGSVHGHNTTFLMICKETGGEKSMGMLR